MEDKRPLLHSTSHQVFNSTYCVRGGAPSSSLSSSADSDEASQRFRLKPATCSDGSQPPIPIEASHPLRVGGAVRGQSSTDGMVSGSNPENSMPAQRLSMRQVREVLRLKHIAGHSERRIAAALNAPRPTVSLQNRPA